MEQYAQTAVERGLELLTPHRDALTRIDLDTLDTGHVSRCVLAATFGSYGKGKQVLGLDTNEAGAAFGFWYPKEFPAREYYVVLTAVWKKVLQELK